MKKLNENDVRNILLDHFVFGASAQWIADNYAISVTHARRIIARKVWKHVTIKPTN